MNKYAMNLQLFAEEGAAAAAPAPAGGGADTGTAAETGSVGNDVRVGDTLGDGTQVTDARVAAALNRQMNRHPELRKVYGQNQNAAQQAQEAPADPGQAGNGPDELQARWEAAKKGEFKELYGNDVRSAISERFKNQADLQKKLDEIQPMLQVMMEKAGVETVEELSDIIMNDDSRFEEAAEEAGLTVEQYKHMKQLEDEHARREAEDRRRAESQQMQRHVSSIRQQAEELKKMFPGFDLDQEMQNPEFIRMTAPGRFTVKQAYMALHGDEMIPQLMGYGMERAQQQMGQTLQAQRSRPVEGAMSAKNQAAAEPALNPASLQRGERSKIKEYVKKYGPISFDRRKT